MSTKVKGNQSIVKKAWDEKTKNELILIKSNMNSTKNKIIIDQFIKKKFSSN